MGDGKKVYDSEGVDQALTNLQTKDRTTFKLLIAHIMHVYSSNIKSYELFY